jgi:YjgF/chorismate_mutase-like, putative endoribonuclease
MHSDSYASEVLARLAQRGLKLPIPSAPAGMYEPYRLERGTGYLAAQLPSRDGQYVLLGRVGAELSVAEGREAAQLAALSALARIQQALNGFTRLRGLLRVDGFVSSADGFLDQPTVRMGLPNCFSGRCRSVGNMRVRRSPRGVSPRTTA